MIPLKITLKNFLSYGPQTQTIDFEPYHLICLSGKNGHGKSALLDAMSWALWGQARKITGNVKPDSQILHLGQTHMKVVFDIALKNSVYRIKREYSKTHGKSGSSLEVSIFDEASAVFRPLTTNALRTTQQKLEDLIGLSYDSFINTAFLRQGSSNEFSKKSPKDRKEILSTILGLNHYDTVRKTTHEKIKHVEIQLHTAQSTHNSLELSLEQLPAISLQLMSINKELQENDQQQKDYATIYTQLQTKEKDIFQEVTNLNNTLKEMLFIDKVHQQHKQELIQTIKEWRVELNRARQIVPVKDADYTQQLEAFQKKSLQYDKLTQRVNDTAQQLANIRQKNERKFHQSQQEHQLLLHECQTRQVVNNQQINQINNLVDTLQQRRTTSQNNIDTFNKDYGSYKIKEHTQKITAFEKHKLYFHQWTAYANSLSTHYTTYNKAEVSLGTNNCPVCYQHLTDQQVSAIMEHNTKKTALLKRRIDRFSKVLPILKRSLIEQNKNIEESQRTLEDYKHRVIQKQHHENALSKDTQELTVLHLKLKELLIAKQEYEDQHKAILEHIAVERKNIDDDVYKNLEKQHTEYIKERDQLNYEQHEHHALLERSKQHIDRLQKNAHSLGVKQQYKTTQQTFIKRILDWKKGCIASSQLSAQKDIIEQKNNELMIYKSKVSQTQDKLILIQHTKGQLLEQKGKVSQHHQQLINNQEQMASISVVIKALSEEKKDLESIYHALGKDGIQALFIEEVIPCIEQEANQLLAQLTDNQSQLFIESLRDLKSGGTKETLDIKIADAQGIRSYELFSGGEAFRIDFALRIAISRLIASRSGGSLQTLIIDEGFGSQDEEGLSHIMDVLYRIQSSFAKIIIVSHLSSMKEQFPVHFVVNKESQGSVVRALQQG